MELWDCLNSQGFGWGTSCIMGPNKLLSVIAMDTLLPLLKLELSARGK